MLLSAIFVTEQQLNEISLNQELVFSTVSSISVLCFLIVSFDHPHDSNGCLLQVCRGTAVMLVSPTEGTDEIANPFQNADGA